MKEANKNILPVSYQDSILQSYYDRSMPMGLGIGCELDNNLVWKQGQFNLMLGIDNVGKTYFKAWYYTALAKIHGLKFDIFSSENEVWSWKMKIMSFYLGENIRNVDQIKMIQAKEWTDDHFRFIDDRNFYTINDLLDIFRETDSKGCLIDPLNSLDEPDYVHTYKYNKQILKEVRHFCKNTGKTVEIIAHAVTEASRRFHKDGDFEGLIMPPEKSHIDGGQIFPNRADDFIILHRYFSEGFRNISYIFVDKVKEVETGGKRTNAGEPIELVFNNYKFYCNGLDPINGHKINDEPKEELEVIRPDGGMSRPFETENEDTNAPF